MIIAICVFIFFALAVSPFMIFLNSIVSSTSFDTLDVGLSGVASMLVWFNLTVALLLAGIHGRMPWWSWLAGVVVMPVYLVAGLSVPELIKDGDTSRWMTSNLVFDGLLVLAYIVWILNPRIRGVLSLNPATVIVWSSIFVFSIIPVSKNLDVTDTDRASKRSKAREAPAKANIAQLGRLPADAPVRDLLPFVSYEETNAEAVRRIRASRNKEDQLAQLVNSGEEVAFAWLDSLDVAPTPAVCNCVRKYLRDLTAEAKRTQGRSISGLDRVLPTVQWAGKSKCPMLEELSAYIAIVRVYFPDAQNTYEPFDAVKRSLQEP